MSYTAEPKQQDTNIKVPLISKIAYGMGDVGCNFSWMFVGNFLMIFYTDVCGISMAAVSLLMLVSRFWDAINDPVIGSLSDRTRSRWGRYRPWLLFGAPATAVVLVLTFWAHPTWSDSAKSLYMYITYCVLVLGYTCVNIPYGTLCGTLTQNIEERAKINTSRSVCAMIAINIINIITLPLISAFGGDNIGKRKVQELRTYDIEKFYATLAKTPCGQYVHGVKQTLTDKQKKRLLSSTSIHEVHTLLKTAFSYAVEWDLIHKIPLPRDAPKVNIEERTIWDEKTMLAALQTIENPALHLAVHMSMILSLREGEILGLQSSDLDFDAADGRGTISVSKTMQRANKDALEKLDPNQVYYTFPNRREGSKSSLILKKPKTKKSNRILYMTKPLKAELLAWLEKLKQDEQNAPEKYNNCGQLFRLPDGLPIAPELLTKWYRLWRAEHPEFEQIVFHGLRHSSATYQLLQSDGDFKSVQGNTGHATAAVLMDTYAHTQDKPRLELTEKIEANFYSQDLTPAAPQPRQNEKPAATKISGKEILEAIRLMDADERRELTRALFA